MAPKQPYPATYRELQALQQQEVAAYAQATPFDPQAFLDDNRLQIEHGSFFFADDPLFVVHPRELHPVNAAGLRRKILRAYSIDYPPLFADNNLATVAAALSSFVPLSQDTKNAVMASTVQKWIEEQQHGSDVDFKREATSRVQPFASVVDHYLREEDIPADVAEFSKNAVALTLMFSEAMQRRGQRQPLTAYGHGAVSPEALVSKLCEQLGIGTNQFLEVTRTQGVQGIGALLGLDEAYMSDLGRLVNYLPKHRFSANAITNWQIGRHIPGMDSAGVHEKIKAGLYLRADARIAQLQALAGGQYDVPDNIKQTEYMLVGALRFLPKPLAETLFLLGTEIAFTPERDLNSIAPGIEAYGFHRKVPRYPDDLEGIYQIFLSGKGDAEAFARVMIHEAHHMLAPVVLSGQQVAKVDELARHDMLRLKALKELMDQWMAGNDQQKAQVVAVLNRPEFSIGGKSFSQMLNGTDMLTFYTQVQHAHDRFQIDSNFYHQSPYPNPESRFLEINSRYAELRYVRLRENPAILQFIVPGISTVYDGIYMPHVEKTLHDLRTRAQEKLLAASAMVDHTNVPPQPIATSQPVIPAPAATATPQTHLGFNPAEKPLNQILATTALQQPLLYHGHRAEMQ